MAIAVIMARRHQEEVLKEVQTVRARIIISKKKGEHRLTIYGQLFQETVELLRQEYQVQHWNEYTQEGEFIRRTYRIFWK